jgi:aminoglycoside phosphotransferase (APT) family kinase protein
MQGVDVEKVSAWLAEHVDGAVAPFEFALIAGGRSNLTFKVTDAAGVHFVLRRPPLGHVLATAHDMTREHRIIAAVGAGSSVPVAPALAVCTDESVNGTPFYVMGYVDGIVLDGPEKARLVPESLRPGLCDDLIDVLAALHAVDPDEIGLGNLAKRDGYIERQLKRWSMQWANSKTREVPAIEEVERRLRANIPEQRGVSIAHGDYRFGNCLIDPTAGRIAAVLDWELCTLGDPLADVGYLGVYWTDAGAQTLRNNDPSGEPGFVDYSDLLERYARITGRDLSAIDFYVAFSNWRLAVISEGVYARYIHGAMANDGFDAREFGSSAELLANVALESAKRLS